jgi:hypothetical protein
MQPVQHKKEWDAVQAFHPKIFMATVTVPVASGMSLANTEAFSELMTDIYWMGKRDDPPYLKIQRFHVLKLEEQLG